MRITIVLGPFFPIPPVLGGAVEKVHFLLGQAYRTAGHEVTFISRRYMDFPDEEMVDGIQHIRVPSSDREPSLAANLALDLRYALRVARRLPKSDVTITNSFFLPMVLPRRAAGRIYVHVARYPKHQMLLYSRANRLQAISQAVADAIIQQVPSLKKKVVTIGYPVSKRYFESSDTTRKKTVLFVGRIAREKGVHLLLRAFARILQGRESKNIAEWKLRIVGPYGVQQGGDGEKYFNELLQIAGPLGSACEFVGPIFDEHSLIAEYRAASVFIYPSLSDRGEAFGLAPLEAMAAGCAVIVSNLRCFAEFVEDEVNGLKFDHRVTDPASTLAEKLERLITQPRLLEQFSWRGQATARKFETSTIATKMLQDFDQLVNGISSTGSAGLH